MPLNMSCKGENDIRSKLWGMDPRGVQPAPTLTLFKVCVYGTVRLISSPILLVFSRSIGCVI